MVIRLVVVVDNEYCPYRRDVYGEWGLSIYVDLGNRAVLFDTGASSEVFRNNFQVLGLDMNKVVMCIISHEHGDHTGGLGYVVEFCHKVPILLPSPSRLARELSGLCRVELNVDEYKVTDGVYAINFTRSFIPEQCLVIEVGNHVILVTGCSHPGIEHMVRTIMGRFRKDIALLIGGFHLFNLPPSEAVQMADKFCRMKGLEKICPLHCTGRTFTQALRERCPEKYVPGHTAAIIEIQDDGTVRYVT